MLIVEIFGGKPLPTRRPRDIVDFLLSKGGIRDDTGELRAMDLHKIAKGKFGRLCRRNGLPPDTAREYAAEAGYLHPDADINDLYQALYNNTHGQPVYSDRDAGDLDAWRQAENDRHAKEQEADLWHPDNLFADL